jgi:DNA-directed RNA polymerase specialized sigma54-like protein
VAERFGEKPVVGMLSYSDFGEHRKDPKVALVREAIAIVRKLRPDLMIDGEMQETPLSDDRIVEILRETGVEIARRTVAKYREALRIPSSVQRRRTMSRVG